VARSDGRSGDAEKPVGRVIHERRGVRSAASEAEQGQGLPQYAFGEDDQHLPAIQSRKRTRLLQGACESYPLVLRERVMYQ